MTLVDRTVNDVGNRPRTADSAARVRPREMTAELRNDLVNAYLAGMGTVELARLHDLNRDVVCSHLKRAGVLRPREALTRDQVTEAMRLRGDGWLFREIGDKFDVHKDTVRRAILRVS